MLRLFDTASGVVAPFSPRDEGAVSLYVCGPTVYGPPHIGHGRMSLVYDVLRRYLEYTGLVVHHVSNVTDIDDKIINRANEERRDWRDVAAESEVEWWSTMDLFGVARPSDVPHATEYIPGMVELVSELVQRGTAYETGDGVYLSVASVPGYGLLGGQSLESRLAGARVEIDEEKRSPADFALWKRAKPGEPTWPSPFGEGRPGWHTECVVMSLTLLGDGFDLHGGGRDLIFPHHENERAQAVAAGRDFSRVWVHSGLVTVGGEKMSKSLGNVFDLADAAKRSDPRSYRLLVLRAHYRSPLEVTSETLADAEAALMRIDALARRFADAGAGIPGPEPELRARFVDAMDNDLDTPGATATLFEALRRANALADGGDLAGGAALARDVLRLFSSLGLETTIASDIDVATADLVRRRDAARAARDFAASDALRSELESLGWHVEDTASGTRVHR